MNQAANNHWIQRRSIEPSTFTHIGRNDRVVSWALNRRRQRSLAPPTRILLLGSGVVEPFTIAALPSASQAQILAVDVDPNLMRLGERLQSGDPVPWSAIAEHSHNAGQANRDLLERARLLSGLRLLEALGSTGRGQLRATPEYLAVDPELGSRVEFIQSDALTVVEAMRNVDFVGDFFLQVNINKDDGSKWGRNYSTKLTGAAVAALAQDGVYVIGDTNRNLPTTLGNIATLSDPLLKVCSLAHAAQLAPNTFVASWYLVLDKGSPWRYLDLIEEVKDHVTQLTVLTEQSISQELLTVSQLAILSEDRLNYAFVATNDNRGIAWSSNEDSTIALARLTALGNSEFSEAIALPAQKPDFAHF